MNADEYARKKHIEAVRAWQKRNPEKVKAYKRSHYRRRRKKARKKSGEEDERNSGN